MVVRDKDGNNYGKSKIAARDGIAKSAATRVLWNIPPPVVMDKMEPLFKSKLTGSACLPFFIICMYARRPLSGVSFQVCYYFLRVIVIFNIIKYLTFRQAVYDYC